MNHPHSIFTLPEQQLTPPENRLANDRADKFEWDVQKYMNTMDAVIAEYAKRIYAEAAVERLMGY
jgi:hypothetical protein